MDLSRITAAVEWQREVHDMQREASDDVSNEILDLLGERGALLVIADAFFQRAPLADREQILLPMLRDMRALNVPQDDRYRQAYLRTLEHFCGLLPPPLPPSG